MSPHVKKINGDNDECESCYKSCTNPDGIHDHSYAKYVDSFLDPCNVDPYNCLGEIYPMEEQLT